MGNICRSPLFEGWARHALMAAAVPPEIELDSAGTGDWHAGQPPDRRAVAAARRRGVDISGLRARQLTAADFERFDLILCADRDNLAWARAKAPRGSRSQLALALDWTGVQSGGEVPDPYQGEASAFDAVCDLASASAAGLLRRLTPRA